MKQSYGTLTLGFVVLCVIVALLSACAEPAPPAPPSGAKAIAAFGFANPAATGTVNELSHTIAVSVPFGTAVDTLVPIIEHTGVSIDPPSGAPNDFTNPVIYTVTAEDASTQNYAVTVTVSPNGSKSITAFYFEAIPATGTINEATHTVSVDVPAGTVVSALVPTIAFEGSSINPASGVANDFTNPATYTVTAANATEQAYVVMVNVTPSAPGTPTLAAEDDSGVSSVDGVTAVTTGLTISGSGIAPGNTIELRDGASEAISSAIANVGGTWVADVTLVAGTHSITARAIGPSGLRSADSLALSITVDTAAPIGAPSAIAPMQGVNTMAEKRPTFVWGAVDGETYYEFQADDNRDFSSLSYDWTFLTGTTYRPGSAMTTSATIPVGTRYHWRVRVLDTAGNAGPWNTGPVRYVNVGRWDKDVNGDGYSDLIVGAPNYTSGGNPYGRVYIYLGGTSIDSTPDLTITGNLSNCYTGCSVAMVGDVNADGFCDYAYGVRGFDYYAGRAVVNRGCWPLVATGLGALNGSNGLSGYDVQVGCTVAGIGDMDGDGYREVAVGSAGNATIKGDIQILRGTAASMQNAGIGVSGLAIDDGFGRSIVGLGDVDNDGYDDFMTCAPYYVNEGRVFVYSGQAQFPVAGGGGFFPLKVPAMSPPVGFYDFGLFLTYIGDFNGDAYADIVLYATGSSGPQAFLFNGSASFDAVSDLGFTNMYLIAGAGDVNGDGFRDLSVLGSSVGIYHGSSVPNATQDATVTGPGTGFYLAEALAWVGDVNGDGIGDILVKDSTSLYLYFGGVSIDSTIDLTITATEFTSSARID